MNAKVILFLFAAIVCAFLQLPSVSGNSLAPCQEPIKVGPCRAMKLRYAFDTGKNECVPFYYGGCQANSNNFVSQEECEQSCM